MKSVNSTFLMAGICLVVLLMVFERCVAQAPTPAAAAHPTRQTPPTASEIAAAARAATLDPANAVATRIGGKHMKFTPVRCQFPLCGGSSPTEKAESASDSAFVGVLENEFAGDETSLPPGKYNIFFANVRGQWKAYAEAGGRIIREAVRATAEHKGGAGERPRFSEKGWCIYVSVAGYTWKACW
jgi:hypothetical protein